MSKEHEMPDEEKALNLFLKYQGDLLEESDGAIEVDEGYVLLYTPETGRLEIVHEPSNGCVIYQLQITLKK